MKTWTILFLLLSTAAAAAAGLTDADRRTLRAACTADIHAVCPEVQPGNGRLKQCIQQKSQQFSETCRNALHKIASREQ